MLHVWSMIPIFIITVCLYHSSSALNILQIVPIISDHQLAFNIRIAETLANAGHHVTLLLCEYNNNNNYTQSIVTSTNINIQYLPMDDEEIRSEVAGSMQSDIDSRAIDSKRPRLPAVIVGAYHRGQLIRRICRYHLSTHQSTLARLATASSFELAIVNADDHHCGLGIVRHLHISNYVLASASALTESLAWTLRVPTPYSYVPSSRSRYADRMRFRQRMHNFAYSILLTIVERCVSIDQQQSDIVEILGDDVGNLEQMLETVPLIFVNTEPLIDYQRPHLHKIVHIGGIGRRKASTQLPSAQSILSTSPQTQQFVLISVDTIGEKWQKSLLKAIQQFPDYLFIWQIDDESNNIEKPSNLLTIADRSPTLQLHLLHDARTRLFIADGSYDSLLNGAYAGVPLMTIPMLADQHKYSRLAEEIGIGVMCNSSAHLIGGMHRAIELSARARAIAQMLDKKVPSDDASMLVRWIEFIGEFGRIDALQVHHLNIIEYFNLDVIAVLLVTPFIVAYLVYRLTLVYYWSCCRMAYKMKAKRD